MNTASTLIDRARQLRAAGLARDVAARRAVEELLAERAPAQRELALKGPAPALQAWRERGDTETRDGLWSAACWDAAGLDAQRAGQPDRAERCTSRAAQALRRAGYTVRTRARSRSRTAPPPPDTWVPLEPTR